MQLNQSFSELLSSTPIQHTIWKSNGAIPQDWSSHVAILYNEDKIFVSGGYNQQSELGDSYIYNISTSDFLTKSWKWVG